MTRSNRAPVALSREDRIAIVRAEVDALPARRTSDRPDAVKGTTDFLPGGYGAVVKAAKERRMSLAAYIRRSAYAMACHDLDVPLADVLRRDPRVTRETGFAVDDPDGTRFGLWEIERLVGEEPDVTGHATP